MVNKEVYISAAFDGEWRCVCVYINDKLITGMVWHDTPRHVATSKLEPDASQHSVVRERLAMRAAGSAELCWVGDDQDAIDQ